MIPTLLRWARTLRPALAATPHPTNPAAWVVQTRRRRYTLHFLGSADDARGEVWEAMWHDLTYRWSGTTARLGIRSAATPTQALIGLPGDREGRAAQLALLQAARDGAA